MTEKIKIYQYKLVLKIVIIDSKNKEIIISEDSKIIDNKVIDN